MVDFIPSFLPTWISLSQTRYIAAAADGDWMTEAIPPNHISRTSGGQWLKHFIIAGSNSGLEIAIPQFGGIIGNCLNSRRVGRRETAMGRGISHWGATITWSQRRDVRQATRGAEITEEWGVNSDYYINIKLIMIINCSLITIQSYHNHIGCGDWKEVFVKRRRVVHNEIEKEKKGLTLT